MNASKRSLIFVPEINPNTFVLFYFEGNRDSRSFSVRDFSDPGRTPSTYYADKFPYTAGEILDLARREGNYCLPTRPHRVDDVSYWHSEIIESNRRLLTSLDTTSPQDRRTGDRPAQIGATIESPLPSARSETNSIPETGALEKTCACGCGMPVNKYDYVWGHKSGSRDSTIPMAAKHLGVNGGLNGGRNHIQMAKQEMLKEIAALEVEIAKRKAAIDALDKIDRQ